MAPVIGKLSDTHIQDVLGQLYAANNDERGQLAIPLIQLCGGWNDPHRRPNRIKRLEEPGIVRFCEIVRAANALGVLHKFLERVLYLVGWGGNENLEYQLSLWPDFAENSMSFQIEGREKLHPVEWHHSISGGLIYWAPKGEAPQENYSHTGPREEPCWLVHT